MIIMATKIRKGPVRSKPFVSSASAAFALALKELWKDLGFQFSAPISIFMLSWSTMRRVILLSLLRRNEEELRKVGGTIEGAKTLGSLIAKRALAKNITHVVFDRSGYLYHGRIKALADAAREGGLKF